MKYHVLVLIAAVALIQFSGSAQSYRIDWHKADTVHTTAPGNVKRVGTLVNLTPTQKKLLFRYDLANVREGHNMALCFDLCFYFFPGEDDPWAREEQMLPGNGSREIYVMVTSNAGTDGYSTVWIKLFDSQDTTKELAFTTTFAVGEVSSVPEASELGITVGPNPSSDVVTINTGENEVNGLNLYSSDGSLIRTYGVDQGNALSIGVADLPVGAYHLVITLSNGTHVRSGVSVIR